MAMYEVDINGQKYNVNADSEEQLPEIISQISSSSNAESNPTKKQEDLQPSNADMQDNKYNVVADVQQEPVSFKDEYTTSLPSMLKSQIDKVYDANANLLNESLSKYPEQKTSIQLKIEQNELARRDAYIKAEDEESRRQTISKAEQSGDAEKVSAPKRFSANFVYSLNKARENITLPVLESLGFTEDAIALKDTIDKSTQALDEINKKYREIYGSDVWDVSGTIGGLPLDIAATVAGGTKNIPSALYEAGATYAKTGDVAEATTAGIATVIGGNLADKLFSLGSKIKYSKDIAKLEDKDPIAASKLKGALSTMEEAGIDVVDGEGMRKIMDRVDLTKSPEEINKTILENVGRLDAVAYGKVKKLYDEADNLAKQTDTVSFDNKLINQLEAISKGTKKEKKAIKEIRAATDLKNMSTSKEFNAYDLEGILMTLKELQRSPSVSTGSKIYGEAIDKISEMQKKLGGDDIYGAARDQYKQYKTMFTGEITGQGYKTGKKISEAIESKDPYYTASKLVGERFKANSVDAIINIGVPQRVRKQMVKDVLMKDILPEEYGSAKGINTMISRFNNADQNGLKKMLGKEYETFSKDINALELIQTTLNGADIDNKLKKSIGSFTTAALMMKAAPFSAARTMAREGKNITTAIAFKKEGERIRNHIKRIPDRTLQNKLLRTFNMITIGVSRDNLNKSFEQDIENTYPKIGEMVQYK